MQLRAYDEQVDPLAEDIVPESVAHSRTTRLVAQVGSLALGGRMATVERLGLRWPDRTVSAPDFFVLPAGSVSWATTSYAPGTDGPAPLVAVEVIGSHAPNPVMMVRRGVPTYLISLEPPGVVRFDPATKRLEVVADNVPCEDLGGMAFRRVGERLGVVDPEGRLWTDPDEHLQALAALAAERDALAARVAELERRLGPG